MSLGQRIKIARRASGLSLRGLAEKMDKRVSAQAISKYERGEVMPGSSVLIALAGALEASMDYLTGNEELVLDTVEFRKKKMRVGKREEAQIEAKVVHLLERYLAVEEFLNLPSANWDTPSGAPWPVLHDPAEAEQAAIWLRTAWGLGLGPISNLVELLEERGIKVLSMATPSIDGLVARVRCKSRGAVCVVVLNEENCGERQRFTAAHELGHIVLDVAPGIDKEKAAHWFAGAFLMPTETLRVEIGKRRKSITWREIFELKRIFGVSAQALTHRCNELGIFNDALKRALFKEFSRLGWSRPPYKEPHEMPGEKPRRFERLCFRALSEDIISEAKAAELLDTSVHDLSRWIDELPDVGPVAEKARQATYDQNHLQGVEHA